MKWIPQDLELYSKAKEYVDTAVIPLVPVAVGEGMQQSASMAEFIALLTGQLERQFTGRLILLPAYTYLQEEDPGQASERLKSWESALLAEGIRHIFFITSDQSWNGHLNNFEGNLIWLPALPMGSLQEQQKVMLINDQVKQLMMLFTSKWKEA